MKKRPLSPDEIQECRALKAIFMERRHDLHLTQEKAADALGMNQGSLSHYLNGRNALNLDFAVRIAKLLGVPVERFSPRIARIIDGMAEVRPARSDEPGTHVAPLDINRLIEKIHGNIPPALRERLESAAAEVAKESAAGIAARPATVGDEIRIAHYDVRAAMGGGQVVPDYPEMLPDVVVSERHLREMGVTYKDAAYLKMMTGIGQSMAPTIQHLDPMIVDISIRQFEGDGIYAFTWQGHFYIKSLQMHDEDHFLMVSESKLYPPKPIRIDDTYIQARVLIVWNARRV